MAMADPQLVQGHIVYIVAGNDAERTCPHYCVRERHSQRFKDDCAE